MLKNLLGHHKRSKAVVFTPRWATKAIIIPLRKKRWLEGSLGISVFIGAPAVETITLKGSPQLPRASTERL
jgi:hypothetical protein